MSWNFSRKINFKVSYNWKRSSKIEIAEWRSDLTKLIIGIKVKRIRRKM